MRRSRIKAVATVPVRRKTTQDTSSATVTNNTENEAEGDLTRVCNQSVSTTESISKSSMNFSKSPNSKTNSHIISEEFQSNLKQEIEIDILDIQSSQRSDVLDIESSQSSNVLDIETSESANVLNIKSSQNSDVFDLKTSQSSDVLNIKSSQSSDFLDIQTSQSTNVLNIKSSQKSDVFDIKTSQSSDALNIKSSQSSVVQASHSENSHLNDSENLNNQLNQPNIQHVQLQMITSPTIQTGSPTKLIPNRSCFMRPTPRLDSSGRVRRNSIHGSGASASESEDDSKKISYPTLNRVRHDSVCSIQSGKETTSNINTSTDSNSITKRKTSIKRKLIVSESARKLAEARREFFLKYENKPPERSQLTMYDLIYYNPTTNPMKKSRESATEMKHNLACESVNSPTNDEEEKEEEEEEEEEDNPSAMPVPQVKVGPDGELIIDEQSLVIEQSDAKKRREILAKKAIVDDDNTGSGFYKRRQKSKDWPKWETLKFYKALNTVGTDFLLMQSLFPNRTRQEIKMKYKKEERINRSLVDKALICHQEFNTESLEQELATFQEPTGLMRKSAQKRKSAESKQDKELKKSKISSKSQRTCRFVTSSIAQEEEDDEDENEDGDEREKVERRKILSRRKGQIKQNSNYQEDIQTTDESEILSNQSNPSETNNNLKQRLMKYNKKRYRRITEEDDPREITEIELSSGESSGSETEIYQVRPTRSGRLPKVNKLQGPDVNTLDSGQEQERSPSPNVTTSLLKLDDSQKQVLNISDNDTDAPDDIRTVIPDISQVEPGSLVILSKESSDEPGQTILQIFMVTSVTTSGNRLEQNITPVDLSPELLATVTSRLSDVQPISVKEE